MEGQNYATGQGMALSNHQLIEIAFTVWNTPASHAMIRNRGAEHTNIPRTRHLAYYLLNQYADMSIEEIAQLFNENKHACKSGIESARFAIESNFITWKSQSMRNKYLQAMNIIRNL